MREFVEGFNTNMRQAMTPGFILTIDEIMSAWKGLCQLFMADGIPHQTKIQRKPEGVGAELKALADGESGILIGVDIMEEKAAMAQKPYAQQYGAGAGVCLRLCQPYSGTPRLLVADSAFASVKTLMAVFSLFGIFFIGAVKTASRMFPKKWLAEWHTRLETGGIVRGNWVTLTSSYERPAGGAAQAGAAPVEALPLIAVGWADKKLKAIISNCGTTLPCPTDSIRPRHKRVLNDVGDYVTSRQELHVKRPEMIELFFRHFGAIDIHDHLRQGSLAFERTWHTKTWWHRIYMTMLGVIITNCYLGYRFEFKKRNHGSIDGMDDFGTSLGKLAYQLIHNSYLDRERVARAAAGGGEGAEGGEGDSDADVEAALHEARPLSSLPAYTGPNAPKRARRRCGYVGEDNVQCGEKTSYYCATCSDVANDIIVCFCNMTHGNRDRACFDKHRRDM